MEFSRNQIGIAAGAGVLLLIIFFGYLIHLNGEGPVLGRSEERDPLSGIPNSISLNPLRDRSSEREAQHPLISWEVADWEDVPPLRILHYRGKRRTTPGQKGTYKVLFSVTLENKGGSWVVTKYDSMY